MISVVLAQNLKDSGLAWNPQNHDFFAIPDRGLDERVFVISDIQSFSSTMHGRPVVTFHGSAEWALDYLITSDVIWLPNADQLRAALSRALAQNAAGEGPQPIVLASVEGRHRCTITFSGQVRTFEADQADDAYGQALLFTLTQGGENGS
jgi:hypothetical protein